MTTALACLLSGLAVLVWPRRAASGAGFLARRRRRSSEVPTRRSLPRILGIDSGRGRAWPNRTLGAAADEVSDALVLVALGLRAGLPLTAALHHVQKGADGAAGRDLAAVVAALRWGLPAHEAWAYAGPGWRAAATAAHLSEQTGAAAAELLEGAAARIREQGERGRERAAARAGVLLVLPLGLGFLPAFACTAVVPVVITLASGVLAGRT